MSKRCQDLTHDKSSVKEGCIRSSHSRAHAFFAWVNSLLAHKVKNSYVTDEEMLSLFTAHYLVTGMTQIAKGGPRAARAIARIRQSQCLTAA
ncbi:hypothetical protein I41_16410 [Lacipirellula limnantheis]|uniref:Uncharacterized protein n=1 Tax=Lacipirellula limnantheis TaxID=2528024 RepID=A0A517TVQ8_9BACT|nr:hypothetical protein I41_16410 [Lacipirellula limnantheis]